MLTCKKRGAIIKKLFIGFLIIELLIIIAGNVLCFSSYAGVADKSYLVESKRLAGELRKSDKKIQGEMTDFNHAAYPHIVSVSPLEQSSTSAEHYVVEEIGGSFYRIEYRQDPPYAALIYMNIGFALMLLMTILLFILIYKKVMRPFSDMERLTIDLAKGHLSTPVNEEKSHVFGRFLWGMDMLRERLEENREREQAYQKERKTLMLSLSHDIKTPLSAIELYEKALSSGLYDTPEKQAEAYAGIRKNSEELRRYIDEITAASREDFLALEVKSGEYYLNDILKEITDYYNEKFASLHTRFVLEEHGNPLLKGDPDRLVEVIQNLLENAIKYGDGREVAISFSEEEDAQLIHVMSTGEPPKEDEMVHLFDSFYRGSNVGEKKGSGLGLYISRELMKRMDGDIYVTAEEESFTAVVVARKS